MCVSCRFLVEKKNCSFSPENVRFFRRVERSRERERGASFFEIRRKKEGALTAEEGEKKIQLILTSSSSSFLICKNNNNKQNDIDVENDPQSERCRHARFGDGQSEASRPEGYHR